MAFRPPYPSDELSLQDKVKKLEKKLKEAILTLNYLKCWPHTHEDVKILVNSALEKINNY